ncbi:MAG: YcxB family protein [Planctomycetota bacterium]
MADNPYASPSSYDGRAEAGLEPPQRAEFDYGVEDFRIDVRRGALATEVGADIVKSGRRHALLFAAMLIGSGVVAWFPGPTTSNISLRHGFALLLWLGAASFIRDAITFRRNLERDVAVSDAAVHDEFEASLTPGRTRVTLNEDKLWLEKPFGGSYWYWQHIDGVERETDRLFICCSKMDFFSVPARAFTNPQDFDAFAQLAERLWAEHQSGEGEPTTAESTTESD